VTTLVVHYERTDMAPPHFQRSAGATHAVSAMIGMSMPAALTWRSASTPPMM